jgi:hypothetical protein
MLLIHYGQCSNVGRGSQSIGAHNARHDFIRIVVAIRSVLVEVWRQLERFMLDTLFELAFRAFHRYRQARGRIDERLVTVRARQFTVPWSSPVRRAITALPFPSGVVREIPYAIVTTKPACRESDVAPFLNAIRAFDRTVDDQGNLLLAGIAAIELAATKDTAVILLIESGDCLHIPSLSCTMLPRALC